MHQNVIHFDFTAKAFRFFIPINDALANETEKTRDEDKSNGSIDVTMI